MRTFLKCFIVLIPLALTAVPAGAAEPVQAEFVGTWQGTLTVGQAELTLIFHIEASEDGKLTATMDSPDQGATGIPVTNVTVDGHSVHLELAALAASFKGKLNREKATIDGHWQQGGHSLPLSVQRDE